MSRGIGTVGVDRFIHDWHTAVGWVCIWCKDVWREDCEHCLRTGLEPIPWTELFTRDPWRR